jgi:hypothetical protein
MTEYTTLPSPPDLTYTPVLPSPVPTVEGIPPVSGVVIRHSHPKVSFIIIGVITLLIIVVWLVVISLMSAKKTGIFKPYSPPNLGNGAQPGGPAVAQSDDIVALKEAALCNAYQMNVNTVPNPAYNASTNTSVPPTIQVPMTIPKGLTCPTA